MIESFDYITSIPNILYGIVVNTVTNSSQINELEVKIPNLFNNVKSIKRPPSSTFLNASPPITSQITINDTIKLKLANPIRAYLIHEGVTIFPQVTISAGQKVTIMKNEFNDITEALIIKI